MLWSWPRCSKSKPLGTECFLIEKGTLSLTAASLAMRSGCFVHQRKKWFEKQGSSAVYQQLHKDLLSQHNQVRFWCFIICNYLTLWADSSPQDRLCLQYDLKFNSGLSFPAVASAEVSELVKKKKKCMFFWYLWIVCFICIKIVCVSFSILFVLYIVLRSVPCKKKKRNYFLVSCGLTGNKTKEIFWII